MGEASDAEASRASPAVRAREEKKTKRADPVRDESKRQHREATAPIRRVLNLGKTALAAILWAMCTPAQVMVIAPYVSYTYAQGVLLCITLMAAILLHLWPPRTAQWRTLFWMFWIIGGVGAIVLYLGGGSASVTLAAVAAVAFMFLRMNQNGRKLVGLIRDWRALR